MPPGSDDLPAVPQDQWAHADNRGAEPPDLDEAAARHGVPARWRFRIAMEEREFRLLDHTGRDGRWQDATILVRHPAEDEHGRPRFAAIAKHWYPPGLHRYPSGTVKPDEGIIDTAVREALEETGLEVEPVRYVLATDGEFYLGDPTQPARTHPWRSHVFVARPTTSDMGDTIVSRLAPQDEREIREAVWVEPSALESAVHPMMLGTGIGGFRYRVGLQERTHAALGLRACPFRVPEGETIGLPPPARGGADRATDP